MAATHSKYIYSVTENPSHQPIYFIAMIHYKKPVFFSIILFKIFFINVNNQICGCPPFCHEQQL